MNHASRQDSAGPVILWQICDGKRGHLSQSTGLIEALGRRIPLAVHQVTAPPLIRSLASCVTGKISWARGLPAPQVAVGAGHATHAALLAAGRACRARTVVLMRPSLPMSWFDYCLVPTHDDPPVRDNVIITTGAVNPMRVTRNHDPDHGLILIGGPSRHYRMDGQALLSRIRRVLARASPRYWTLSNSPRTPGQVNRELAGLRTDRVEVALWDRCGPGWLAGALARARDVWVTEDSVSMIYEALTSGCRVGLLPMQRNSTSRLHRAIDRLLEEGFVSAHNDRGGGAELPAPPRTLNEADRCAGLLLKKGLLSGTAGAAICP